MKKQKIKLHMIQILDHRYASRHAKRNNTWSYLTSLLILCIFFIGCQQVYSQSLNSTQKNWINKASRHEKNGWIYLHIEGPAYERGFQHGYLLAKEIDLGLKTTRKNWEYGTSMDWNWFVEKGSALFMSKIDEENLSEIRGILEGLKAAGVNSSINEMVAYNGWIELRSYWWPGELKKIKEMPVPGGRESCSSFIATGRMTVDGSIVLGHNTMSSYNEYYPNVIIDILPDKGHRMLMQITAGWIHSGTDFFITSAGLVGSETTIAGFDSFDGQGIPEFTRMRRATQDANTIDEWCGIMKKGNNGGYANAWLLGDVNTGEIARLELGLKYIGYEKKKDGCFMGSNIAENLKILRLETTSDETDISKMEVARRVRWKQLMAENVGKIDLAMAKLFEADHYDPFLEEVRLGGRGLCCHGELERTPCGWPSVPYGPGGTVDAKVVDSKMARNMSFSARWGSACGTAFDAEKFLKAHPQFDWMKEILVSRSSEPWTVFSAGETK
jgi:hypothetical protein